MNVNSMQRAILIVASVLILFVLLISILDDAFTPYYFLISVTISVVFLFVACKGNDK